ITYLYPNPPPSPPPEILIKEPEGFSIWTGPPFPSTKLSKTQCISSKFSEDDFDPEKDLPVGSKLQEPANHVRLDASR
ncbi:hypothetical protein Leryth_025832, partial [Lithospermum erythrorhizon]